MIRRVALPIGVALLVGGLCTMWFAHEQMRVGEGNLGWQQEAWYTGGVEVGTVPMRLVTIAGAAAATLGAAISVSRACARRE